MYFKKIVYCFLPLNCKSRACANCREEGEIGNTEMYREGKKFLTSTLRMNYQYYVALPGIFFT